MTRTETDGGRRTLVVHTGGIGDFLLTCPALLLLARHGPVELMGRPERLCLAHQAGIVIAVHDIEDYSFETLFGAPNERLRAFLSGFDRVILWLKEADALLRSVRGCGVAEAQAFPGVPPEQWNGHASRYYLHCLGFPEAPPLALDIAPSATGRDVVVHPGSGGQGKNWPMARFIELAFLLEKQGRCVTWCLGPAEARFRVPDNKECLRLGSLVDLAHELAAARLYVGNDSGITHLAAAVGCPTLAIFGPTAPAIWAPLGNHVIVTQGNPWPETAEVFRKAMTALAGG